jgi:hypothetical protein
MQLERDATDWGSSGEKRAGSRLRSDDWKLEVSRVTATLYPRSI